MKTTVRTIGILVALASIYTHADDAETALERAKKLETMSFRDQQLKYQASMAEHYRKMADAGFLVSEDGKPVGIEDMTKLANEFRNKGNGAPANGDFPFPTGAPSMPNGSPFPMEPPPASIAGQMPPPVQQAMPGTHEAAGKPGADPEEAPKPLRLVEIRKDSILVATDSGLTEKKIGEKVYDLTLKRIDVDFAYLVGPKGPQVLKIDWYGARR